MRISDWSSDVCSSDLVHAGETPEAALVRELHEELGIDTRQSCLAPIAFASHAYDDFHLLMPLFACRTWQGQPQGRRPAPRLGEAGAPCRLSHAAGRRAAGRPAARPALACLRHFRKLLRGLATDGCWSVEY